MFEVNSTAQWLTLSYWTRDSLHLSVKLHPSQKCEGTLWFFTFFQFGGLISQIFHICAATWSSGEKRKKKIFDKLLMEKFSTEMEFVRRCMSRDWDLRSSCSLNCDIVIKGERNRIIFTFKKCEFVILYVTGMTRPW